MEVSGHNWKVPYSKLFLRVVSQSQLRTQRKINGSEMARMPDPRRHARFTGQIHPRRRDLRTAFDEGEFGTIVLAAAFIPSALIVFAIAFFDLASIARDAATLLCATSGGAV
jgi:hypothetical protein